VLSAAVPYKATQS